MKKVYVFRGPVRTDTYASDDNDHIHHPKREKLANRSTELSQKMLDEHPEVQLVMNLIYTPKPSDWPRGVPYDNCHTALVSQDKATVGDLGRFLDFIIPSLINLRHMLDDSPEEFFKSKKGGSDGPAG